MSTAEELPQQQYRGLPDDQRGTRKLISSGERRLDYLDKTIDREMGSPSSLNFDRAERMFVRAALKALRWHHAILEEDDETNPLLVLQDLIAELAQLDLPDDTPRHDRLHNLIARGRRILKELGVVAD